MTALSTVEEATDERNRGSSSDGAPKPVVTVEPLVAIVQAGRTRMARVRLQIEHGYHIQANPASDPFLVPLQLQVRSGRGIKAGRPVYPKGKTYRLAGMDSDWMTYDGSIEVLVPLESDPASSAGERIVRGVLRYQACDDRSCLFPASLQVGIPVHVEAEQQAGLLSTNPALG